jgi:hypothetical protein
MKFIPYLLSALLCFGNVCHADSGNVYFPNIDFENNQPTDTLLLLKDFRPIQQTTEYTCGPVCADMVVRYYEGQPRHSEQETANIMGINAYTGTMPAKMEKYFKKLGYQAEAIGKRYELKSYDDVLIMADPMDVADGKQDGYTVINARKFFFTWFSVGTPMRVRQGILVRPL